MLRIFLAIASQLTNMIKLDRILSHVHKYILHC